MSTLRINSIYFKAEGFPSWEELKKRGWKTPGGDEKLIKATLVRTIGDQQIMLVEGHDGTRGVIFPLAPSDPGYTMTEALAAIADIFESLED